ncbi:hypothetical protein ABZ356_04400 [Micromonospora zamorensis]|uniref:hypothetical protein n=1 Tax=Micromonospora zamorensis TaxID=709883 RepID=UPI0033F788C7
MTLNPPRSGPQRLSVRTIDLAGNVSPTVTYGTCVRRGEPEVQVENGAPVWGQEVGAQVRPGARCHRRSRLRDHPGRRRAADASDVYYSPDGSAVGGVGVEGTFTFSPPPGWTDTAAYRYSFDDAEQTEVAADGNGRATIPWTPTASGYVTSTVYPVRADGTVSRDATWYYFEVAATAA